MNEEELIAIRRDLHRHPELAYQEERTAQLITKFLQSHGLQPRRMAGTGVVADLGEGNPTIALRADMDALVLQEKNDFEHRSKHDGVMHACGHDGHMTILLGCVAALTEEQQHLLPHGTIRFIFQPAEEGGAGARKMMDEGALEAVDRIYGLHNWPANRFGTIGVKPGPVMAASSLFEVTVRGSGGHGSQPQNTRDPLTTAARIIDALQAIVSREVDPREAVVLSVCTIHGGTAKNIIPDDVTFSGTIRSLDDDRNDWVGTRISEIARSLAQAAGCRAEVRYQRQYPALVNHPAEAEVVAEVARRVLGQDAPITEGLPVMGAEDFSFYLQRCPGAFFFLGAAQQDGEPVNLHQSRYDFNDALIPLGIKMFLGLIEQELRPG